MFALGFVHHLQLGLALAIQNLLAVLIQLELGDDHLYQETNKGGTHLPTGYKKSARQ